MEKGQNEKLDTVQVKGIYNCNVKIETHLPLFAIVAHFANEGILDSATFLETVISSWIQLPKTHIPLPADGWQWLFEQGWWQSRPFKGAMDHERSPRDENVPTLLFHGGPLNGPSWTKSRIVAEHFAKNTVPHLIG